ncbi:heavy metal translocating P-type ATPase [Cohnella caldifontis]|uniref:heavy metal translocating P-type ATPase n=1 Tax=Cohnella caldifontis TaxID=3027471 RepID=UPI0023EBFF51|nr:heavy metal translocating P-type ATPase [Cohnella sp. YIM B05605]
MPQASDRGSAEARGVYRLQGLSCANCAAQFERNVKEIDGVEDAVLNFGASKLTVIGRATVEQLEKAGAFDGIQVYPDRRNASEIKVPLWRRHTFRSFSGSAVLLLAAWGLSASAGTAEWPSTLLYAAAILAGGYALFLKGLRNLIRLRFDMNTLMTVAILGAAAIGEWQEGAVVVLLFALSEWLESYSMEKARKSIRSLIDMAPKEALIRRGGEEKTVPVEEISVGDVMILKPGQRVAMDGRVIRGNSSVDEAAITGESVPAAKAPGDEVYAGTLNEEGLLEAEVTKRAEDTTLAKIIHMVEEAQAEKAPTQAFIDKFAKFYTPAILLIALGTILLPPLLGHGSWSQWLYEGLALLVVGCPCALVVSTPVAVVTAIGNAARNGVLIKGGIHLEEMGRVRAVAFDKTGTLTQGIPEVTDIVSLSGTDDRHWLGIAAAIEKNSLHPLASAIVRQAERMAVDPGVWKMSDFLSATGKGAQASWNGALYRIGSPAWFRELGIPLTEEAESRTLALQQQGKTVMLLATEERIAALFAVADQVRASGRTVIRSLKEAGIRKTVMLTGDNRTAAAAIGAQLGVDGTKAELLPQRKLEEIKRLLAEYGKVAMVGDGVNDAPALAAASVGVAMGGAGTDTALETADIALMGDDLAKLPYTIRLSRRTLRVIQQNVGFALAVKLIAVLLVVPGWLTLWIAIFADMGATLIVMLNSLRLARTKR